MKFSLALTALLLPILVNAQTGTNASTTTSAASPSASPSSISVLVAPFNALAFSVENIVAANGSEIVFTWNNTALPHSVTQSTFGAPCTPVSSGFSSGLLTNGEFTLTVVDDTIPVYVFCEVMQHCSRGMVAAINAPANGTGSAAAFLAAALAVGSNQPTISSAGVQTGGAVGGVVASSSPSTAASSASKPTSASSSSSDAGRLVANGVYALLATALGMTLA